MEKLSRVKKYAELRKSIETENAISDVSRDAMSSEQQEALKKFDSSILKRANIENETTPKREKNEPLQQREASDVEDTFTNEYLDDFIREVREYNIKKGTRENEDTQIDILSQLSAANRAKRAHYVEQIEDIKEAVPSDLAQAVANLVEDDNNSSQASVEHEDLYATTEMLLDNDTNSQTSLEDMVESLQKTQPLPTADEETAVSEDTEDIDNEETNFESDTMHRKLMEETQQLRVQMDEYEEELTDLSDGVEKNNRILNFILAFLIFILLAIIGFIAYYIWKGGMLS